MSTTKMTIAQLENLIKQAIAKVGASKENDLCRYIPVPTGGYIHHFTMRKMKTENPEELAAMIQKYILSEDKPKKVAPKQRAARGSRKPRDTFLFSKNDIERLLNIARAAGDKDMIRKLTPRQDEKTIKRELISSIRHGRVEHDLWASWVEIKGGSQSNQTPYVQAQGHQPHSHSNHHHAYAGSTNGVSFE